LTRLHLLCMQHVPAFLAFRAPLTVLTLAQGTTSLLESSAPIWILGICYCDAAGQDAEEGSSLKQEVGVMLSQSHPVLFCRPSPMLTRPATPCAWQVLNAVLSDLMSRIWMTYRRGFPPIGAPSASLCFFTSSYLCCLSLTCMLVLSSQAAQASSVTWAGAAPCAADRCSSRRQGVPAFPPTSFGRCMRGRQTSLEAEALQKAL
jgi:hypothetical protein